MGWRTILGRGGWWFGLLGAGLASFRVLGTPAAADDATGRATNMAVASSTVALDALLDAGDAVWKLTPDQFMAIEARHGFHWTSASDQDAARSVNRRLTFLGFPVWEAQARFRAGSLQEMVLSLYNRGDAGELNESEFDRFQARVDRALTAWAGNRGFEYREEELTPMVSVRRKTWIRPPHRLDLSWSYTPKHRESGVMVPFQAEYVRLRLSRANPEVVGPNPVPEAEGGPPRPLSIVDLRDRVVRRANGDVFIEGIPMVNQGQKGYCAAAVAERVMRYYHQAVDQHEIAQLAESSPTGGTSYPAMIEALRRISDHTEMDVDILIDFNVRTFDRLLRDYNSLSRHAHQPEIVLAPGQPIDPVEVFNRMDPELYKVARVKRHVALIEFKDFVKKYVSHGVPLVWSVIVGKIRETPPLHATRAFGHMRLIIGYNDRTAEILYSDTWGAGHERKRMSLDDAWTITIGLCTVEPRNIRF